jgi:hypothetical protein
LVEERLFGHAERLGNHLAFARALDDDGGSLVGVGLGLRAAVRRWPLVPHRSGGFGTLSGGVGADQPAAFGGVVLRRHPNHSTRTVAALGSDLRGSRRNGSLGLLYPEPTPVARRPGARTGAKAHG